MRPAWIVGVVFTTVLPAQAQLCDPQKFEGAYGSQLSGSTTISGNKKPVASIGLLEFDGEGGVKGTASVNFAGFLQGNPVTGTYEVRNDCTIKWSLQDDSGAFQHFAGKLTPDLERATFQQTDPGGAQRGTLAKTAPQCSDAALQAAYDYTVSGSAIPMKPGESARNISLQGVLTAGTATVDSDCIVNIVLTPSGGPPVKLRGVLVSGGKEILAIATDPGVTANARFQARPLTNPARGGKP